MNGDRPLRFPEAITGTALQMQLYDRAVSLWHAARAKPTGPTIDDCCAIADAWRAFTAEFIDQTPGA